MEGAAITPTPMYLCITKLDLSYCVNKLSQYMNVPSDNHWRAVKRVLRYLIGTIDHGLWFSKGQLKLVSYFDADWASSADDRHSTIGYVIFLGSNPIAWCSKKEAVVSRSSSEAEYHSLANSNPTYHARVKHVEIDHHFVREKVVDSTLQVNFVPPAHQIADELTKPIASK
ncbi:hypothetical protein CXB51_010154 [Gossypium anomalum]|uniref:Reverse transcriptase Ty1/copia-type domain-containing protein n=1 Tax=Gossypium anomalum TaxID=47600 RepID=A0A8J6D473_9ROSI|nr:hypothetical protein CXB51_010154 [Gossypium anomalum]